MRSFSLVLLGALGTAALSIPQQRQGAALDLGARSGGVVDSSSLNQRGGERRHRRRSNRNRRTCAPKPPVTTEDPTSTSTDPVSTSTEPVATSTEPVVTSTEPVPTSTEAEPPVTTDEPSTTEVENPVPTTTEAPPPPPPPTTTEAPPAEGPTKTQDGPTPSATKATSDDPYLTSLSIPLNYGGIPEFAAKKTGGVMTYYAQSQTACGDTYDDSTYTAAVSKLLYDSWPGANTASTNRNPMCGPWVEGRYFLTPAEEVVPGKMHSTIGGDGFNNCQLGEQCHVPLTATVFNPATNASLTVSIVDRCDGCQPSDIDLTPAAFLKLSRPDLDTSGFSLQDYMVEASKDQQGRVPIEWSFDQKQLFKGVVGEMGGKGCVGGCLSP